MLVLVIPQIYTSVLLIWDLILSLLLLFFFSDKLDVWRSQEIQYFLACQCPGRNWGSSCHELLHAMPTKPGNALLLFKNFIIQKCEVVSGHFRPFT